MNNDQLVRKLEQVIKDTEELIDRDQKKGDKPGASKGSPKNLMPCLNKITGYTSKIDKSLTECLSHSDTNSKVDYMTCLDKVDTVLSKIYQDVIFSDDCLKLDKASRRKAIIYLGALYHLTDVKNCLQNNSYFESAGCIEEKFGWEQPSKQSKQKVKATKTTKPVKSKPKTKVNKTKHGGKHLVNAGWVPISKFTT